MGKIMLGMPGAWAESYHEAADHYTTKIGGLPDWPISKMDIMRPDMLQCGQCRTHLSLVLQLYAPITTDHLKIEERIIYVFGCASGKCGTNPLSWRALRVQLSKKEEESALRAQKSSKENETSSENAEQFAPAVSCESISKDKLGNVPSHACGEKNDDVNDDDMDLEELGRALYEAASLASHSKKKKKTNRNRKRESAVKSSPVRPVTGAVDTSIPVLPCFYICSQEEASFGDVNALCSNYKSLSIEKENNGDDHREEEMWEEESYEYDNALYVDRTYLKFKKRIDAYPEQCFRYWYGGKPLLATRESEVPGNCGYCGAPRHYEMQLMPPLLFFLHEGSDSSSTHSLEEWNWMTLTVYTCSKNCSPPVYQEKSTNENWTMAEEAVILQLD